MQDHVMAQHPAAILPVTASFTIPNTPAPRQNSFLADFEKAANHYRLGRYMMIMEALYSARYST